MIEQHGTGKDKFYTDTRYWDCECDKDYIHKRADVQYCCICKCYEHDMPDSRINEIKEMEKVTI